MLPTTNNSARNSVAPEFVGIQRNVVKTAANVSVTVFVELATIARRTPREDFDIHLRQRGTGGRIRDLLCQKGWCPSTGIPMCGGDGRTSETLQEMGHKRGFQQTIVATFRIEQIQSKQTKIDSGNGLAVETAKNDSPRVRQHLDVAIVLRDHNPHRSGVVRLRTTIIPE